MLLSCAVSWAYDRISVMAFLPAAAVEFPTPSIRSPNADGRSFSRRRRVHVRRVLEVLVQLRIPRCHRRQAQT